MALEKRESLYRLRVLWSPEGSIELVETVRKSQVVDGDTVVGQGGEATVAFVADERLKAKIDAVLADLPRAQAAEAKRLADEAERKAREAVERARAEAAQKKAEQDAAAEAAAKAEIESDKADAT